MAELKFKRLSFPQVVDWTLEAGDCGFSHGLNVIIMCSNGLVKRSMKRMRGLVERTTFCALSKVLLACLTPARRTRKSEQYINFSLHCINVLQGILVYHYLHL